MGLAGVRRPRTAVTRRSLSIRVKVLPFKGGGQPFDGVVYGLHVGMYSLRAR